MMVAREEGGEVKGVVKKEQSETTSKDQVWEAGLLGERSGRIQIKNLVLAILSLE